MLAGTSKHSGLPFTHTTASTLANALTVAQARESAYQAARHARTAAYAAQHSARAGARDFVAKSRNALQVFLGVRWSATWAQAGFKSTTLAVPSSVAGLRETLRLLSDYLTAHVPHQNATAGVTATAATAQFNALKGAIEQVNSTRTDQRVKRDDRTAAETTLRNTMTALTNELRAILPPDDPRWLDFVNEVPADPQRPEVVTGLVARGGSPGEVDLEWESSARAERYQVEILVEGTDTAFRHAATVHDEFATMTDLAPGARVRLRVVAANDAGESVPSAEVEAQVPLANAA